MSEYQEFTGKSVEEALDIEWAHVAAPKANIILFEAAGGTTGAGGVGLGVAGRLPGEGVEDLPVGLVQAEFHLVRKARTYAEAAHAGPRAGVR